MGLCRYWHVKKDNAKELQLATFDLACRRCFDNCTIAHVLVGHWRGNKQPLIEGKMHSHVLQNVPIQAAWNTQLEWQSQILHWEAFSCRCSWLGSSSIVIAPVIGKRIASIWNCFFSPSTRMMPLTATSWWLTFKMFARVAQSNTTWQIHVFFARIYFFSATNLRETFMNEHQKENGYDWTNLILSFWAIAKWIA